MQFRIASLGKEARVCMPMYSVHKLASREPLHNVIASPRLSKIFSSPIAEILPITSHIKTTNTAWWFAATPLLTMYVHIRLGR